VRLVSSHSRKTMSRNCSFKTFIRHSY
jgi:hypothetical protein